MPKWIRQQQHLIPYMMFMLGAWSLSGCSPQPETEPAQALAMKPNAPSPTLTCSYPVCSPWTYPFIQQHLVDFEYEHADLHFNIVPAPCSGAEEAERIVQAIRTHNYSRTVIRFNNDIYNRVARALNNPNWHLEYLINFAEKPAFLAAHNSNAVQHILTQKSYKHFLPGTILEGLSNCIWINQALARKMNIHISGPELSTTELSYAARKLKHYNQVHSTPIYLLHTRAHDSRLHKLFSSIYLSQLCDANGTLVTSHPPAVYEKTLRETLEFIKALIPPPNQTITDDMKEYDLFIHDQLLFYIHFTSSYSLFSTTKGKKWIQNVQPLALPTTGPFNYSTGYFSTFWAILKDAPHSERAEQFMHYMARPEIAAEWTRRTHSATGIAGALYDPASSKERFGQFLSYQNKKQDGALIPLESLLKTVWPWKPFPQNAELRECILELLTPTVTTEEIYTHLTRQAISNRR